MRNCPERKKTLQEKNGKWVLPTDPYWFCQLAYYEYEQSLANEFQQKLKTFVTDVNPQAVLGQAYKNFWLNNVGMSARFVFDDMVKQRGIVLENNHYMGNVVLDNEKTKGEVAKEIERIRALIATQSKAQLPNVK